MKIMLMSLAKIWSAAMIETRPGLSAGKLAENERTRASASVRLRIIVGILLGYATWGAETAAAQDAYEAYYLYLGEYPRDANPGWHEEAQGVAHDDDHWF